MSKLFKILPPLAVTQATIEQHSSTGDSKHKGSLRRLPRRMKGCLHLGKHSNTPLGVHSHDSSHPRSMCSPTYEICLDSIQLFLKYHGTM